MTTYGIRLHSYDPISQTCLSSWVGIDQATDGLVATFDHTAVVTFPTEWAANHIAERFRLLHDEAIVFEMTDGEWNLIVGKSSETNEF